MHSVPWFKLLGTLPNKNIDQGCNLKVALCPSGMRKKALAHLHVLMYLANLKYIYGYGKRNNLAGTEREILSCLKQFSQASMHHASRTS
jgi:hypothetical protein